MLLRNNNGWRTVVWAALSIAAGLQYARPQWIPILCPVSIYLALAVGVIAHNHTRSAFITLRARASVAPA